MREFVRRHWSGLRGDWRYPAAMAVLVFGVVFAFGQYQLVTDQNDTAGLARFAIDQNDRMSQQLDALNENSTCRSQLTVDVDLTKGQVILLQGQLTATVGQMIVELFDQNRPALAESITRLSTVNQLLADASRHYQEALDRRANTNNICVDASPPSVAESP